MARADGAEAYYLFNDFEQLTKTFAVQSHYPVEIDLGGGRLSFCARRPGDGRASGRRRARFAFRY